MESVSIECKPQLLDNLDNTQLSPKTDLTEEEHNDSLRTYSCNYPNCTKTFRYRSEITRHMVTHSDQRPYLCPYNRCNRGFKRLDALATHVRLHTGDKPFKCPVGSCQLTFATKAGLRYHTLKHKNNKLYKCDYSGCEQSFLTMSQLKQHKRGAKVHDVLTSPTMQDPSQDCNESKVHHELSIDCDKPTWLSCSEYEPAIQKRLQIEKPSIPQLAPTASKQIHQLSVFGVNLKTERLDSGASSGRLLPSATQVRTNGNLTSGPFSDLTGTLSNSARKSGKDIKDELDLGSGNQLDQTKLLKSINKVLDENMALKQHLEVCQKIISIYQANLGELKDAPLE